MVHVFQTVITLIVAYVLTLVLGGCTMPGAMPGDFAAVVQSMVRHVEDQGVLDDFKSALDAHVQDPGMESYLEFRLTAGVALVGVNGEVDLSTHGTGTQLPKGVREGLIEQLAGPISDDQRAAILDVLGWNRVESPHNPVP